MGSSLPSARQLFADASTPAELAERHEALVKASTEATISGLSGETYFDGQHESGTVMVSKRADKRREVRKALDDLELAKSVDPAVMAALNTQLTGSNAEMLSKEWTLANPISTGLVPYDLEAPAKLLAPRPTPLRNSIPRVKGHGASRRFKVISGFTGSGTGGATTLNGGLNESTTNTGPGGLAYVRPPYISYDGYDVVVSYVSWGLSDSTSWQAEYEGQGFQDIRSLSNTALLYATMLLDERLDLYGRGTTGNGYTGALGTPTFTASAVAGSSSPAGSSTLAATTYYVVIAADGGDLLGTNGGLHQGPTTAAQSVTTTAGQAIKIQVTADVVGALGYNIFLGTSAGGPFYYSGRTGYNVGWITAPVTTGTSVSASAADASAVSTNFDGLLTNLAANGGYVSRLNGTFSTTTPGAELQTCFSSLWDATKADPDEIWLNGHDRNQLANALLSGNNVNNYRIQIPDGSINGIRVGAVVQGIYNQITGKEVDFNVHPWLPQGNVMVRSVTLPIPDSNVTQTSVMAMVQDYVAVQWPVQQFTYDSSTLELGSLIHYAPVYSGLIQGVQLSG